MGLKILLIQQMIGGLKPTLFNLVCGTQSKQKINLCKLSNFLLPSVFINNRASRKKIKMLQSISPNIRLNPYHNNALSFLGKSQVMQKVFGEQFLIPKAVYDAIPCSKTISVRKMTEKPIINGNAVYLGGDKFLTLAHCFEDSYDYLDIRKELLEKNNDIFTVPGKAVELSEDLDLAIIKSQIKETRGFAKSLPIKIADKSPKVKDTVYIIGSNGFWEGQKAIPATVLTESEKFSVNSSVGHKANYYHIKSEFPFKRNNEFSADGLSGSPIVNKEGELVGILKAGRNNSEFLIIDLDTIKKFLSTH